MPRPSQPDPRLPFIVTRTQAVDAGMTVDQIRQRVRSGKWTRLAHGAYRRNGAVADDSGDCFAAERRAHAELAAAQAHASAGCVIAGFSAAAVHDIPVISALPDYVSLVRPGSAGELRAGARIRGWRVAPEDIQQTSPPVTGLARTWLDVAREGTLADALSAGDHLLRGLYASLEELTAVVGRSDTSRGRRRIHLALAHVSRMRESPLESASWAYFLERRIALPQMQVVVRTAGGRFIGRVDFLWPEHRLVGECDGRAKYAHPDDLYAEKRREDALRAEGLRVTRWGLSDLRTDALAAHLRRTLAQVS